LSQLFLKRKVEKLPRNTIIYWVRGGGPSPFAPPLKRGAKGKKEREEGNSEGTGEAWAARAEIEGDRSAPFLFSSTYFLGGRRKRERIRRTAKEKAPYLLDPNDKEKKGNTSAASFARRPGKKTT